VLIVLIEQYEVNGDLRQPETILKGHHCRGTEARETFQRFTNYAMPRLASHTSGPQREKQGARNIQNVSLREMKYQWWVELRSTS
jgi:hypothetical protein